MNMLRTAIALVLAAGLAACTINLKAPPLPSASVPQGVTVRMTYSGSSIVGELLEVREDAFLVLTKEPLVRLLPRKGATIEFDAPEPVTANPQLLSRFPQGLTPELLQQLLRSCGQTDVAGVKRGPDTFLDRARAGTARYADQQTAIIDGYRKIGRDFPAMGEHWIRIGLVFDAVVDPARPEVLNYVSVGGRPVLVGLGYAVPLLEGESAPDEPAGRDAWHDHSKTIDEETFMTHVHGQEREVIRGPRLAMLHAWINATNPDGIFAADNWGLPYVRLGLDVPSAAPADAAKALSLLTGGLDYFEAQLGAAHASMGHHMDLRPALLAARTKAEAIVRSRRSNLLSAEELLALANVWGGATGQR
jgi:hypothetical protein